MDERLIDRFQQEIELQCEAAVSAFARMDVLLTQMMQLTSADMRPLQDFWRCAQTALSCSANVSRLLWGSNATAEQRRRPLRESLAVSDSSCLRSRVMRNHIEHFDERLEKWWNDEPNHNFVDRNIGDWRGTAINNPLQVFRNFDPATGELIFWGDVYHTTAVRDALAGLLLTTEEVLDERHPWRQQLRLY